MSLIDQQERLEALDPLNSYIVQAPAGSGKTELLIQRCLALLARVKRPQQILAITFTRKAAAEMRSRLLGALELAQGDCPEEAHKKHTWELAKAVLKQDTEHGWDLLHNPNQLNITTIDSFNATLVRKMPWLSRFGSLPEMSNDPKRLYLLAAQKLLSRLDADDAGADQIAILLNHLDNRVDRLQDMLQELLSRRDQWLRHLLHMTGSDPKIILEENLREVVEEILAQVSCCLTATQKEEILFCGRFAADNLADAGDRPLLTLQGKTTFPDPSVVDMAAWRGLADLLLTSGGPLRKPGGVNKNCGFPAGSEHAEAKKRFKTLLDSLIADPVVDGLICKLGSLPAPVYSADQWRVLEALVTVLPMLVAELWLVFRNEGQADFAETALKANQALGDADDPSDLLLKIDSDLIHVLVDEFQDTNLMQNELLETLTSGWVEGDGRTLFLVGDPMQSIYRFREAEVGLFLNACKGTFGSAGLPIKPLRLQANFRSQQGLVDWVNTAFAQILPPDLDVATGAVPLAEAVAVKEQLAGPACSVYPLPAKDPLGEALQVAAVAERIRAEYPDDTAAILVRSRTHLPDILRELCRRKIPYQAQDIDQLGEQPEALDILSLTRALLHRADRLSWLSVLRAPWVGLSLADLHALVDGKPKATIPALLNDPTQCKSLSEEGQKGLARAWPILVGGLQRRGRVGLRSLVEGCWLALGGPVCYSPEAVNNAKMVFDLLEELEQGGDLPDLSLFEKRMEKLFATPDTSADGKLQVMTIHKSKGLEFSHLLIPGLGRPPHRGDTPLLRWTDHPVHGLLVAPIAPRDGSNQDPVYKFIAGIEEAKEQHETARLLYVATTRAKSRIHLFASTRQNSQGALVPEKGTLLELLWPLVADHFADLEMADSQQADSREVVLRRLPLTWAAPQLMLAKVTASKESTAASLTTGADMSQSTWKNRIQRQVGTTVHAMLERIANHGLQAWEDLSVDQQAKIMHSELVSSGVPYDDLEKTLKKVVKAVEQTLMSNRGRWILDSHKEAACELPLSGVVNGTVLHATIDRSFLDDDDVKWVIDYKSSEPQANETLADFLKTEEEKYRGQLESYRELMLAQNPSSQVRSGLYFPLIDCWYEVM